MGELRWLWKCSLFYIASPILELFFDKSGCYFGLVGNLSYTQAWGHPLCQSELSRIFFYKPPSGPLFWKSFSVRPALIFFLLKLHYLGLNHWSVSSCFLTVFSPGNLSYQLFTKEVSHFCLSVLWINDSVGNADKGVMTSKQVRLQKGLEQLTF